MYDRGGQTVAWQSKIFVAMAVCITLVFTLLVLLGCPGPNISVGVPLFSWLCVVYWLSLVKLAVTVSKYIPQALMNCQNRSTLGWSIGNVLLDFTGGALSIGQLLLDGATLGWGGVIGDPIKFALGFVSMIFDVLFMVQHYCLFSHTNRRRGSSSYKGAGESIEYFIQSPTAVDYSVTNSYSVKWDTLPSDSSLQREHLNEQLLHSSRISSETPDSI
jgi:cystinosin